MPRFDRHLAQAERNERLYHSLDVRTTEFLDWAITALFYSALHYVDAYLAAMVPPGGSHPTNHGERSLWIARTAGLREIQVEYRRLRDYSEDARYGLVNFSAQQVSNIKDNEFTAVKQHIRSRLDLPTSP